MVKSAYALIMTSTPRFSHLDDINECMTNQHSCDNGYTCQNTIGFYSILTANDNNTDVIMSSTDC